MSITVIATKIASNNTLLINTLSRAYVWHVVDAQGNTTEILPHMLTNGLSVSADVSFYASHIKPTISHYVSDSADCFVISVDEYRAERNKLESEYDDDAELWSSIDAEYEFKKFVAKWKPVNETKKVTEKAVIEINKEVQFETGSNHITSTFVIGGNSSNALYTLNVKAAVREAFFNKMKELGMEQLGSDAGYEMTKDRKVFSIEKHGDMRYTKAFGRYIFNDTYNPDKMQTNRTSNNLEELQALEKEYVAKMEDYIETAYKKHFVRPVADGILLSDLSNLLNNLLSNVQNIDSKASTRNYKIAAINDVKKLISDVNEAIKKA